MTELPQFFDNFGSLFAKGALALGSLTVSDYPRVRGIAYLHGRSFVSVIAAGGLALVFAERIPVAVAAEDAATAGRPAVSSGANTQSTTATPSPNAATPSPSTPDASPSGAGTPLESTDTAPVPSADPVIASSRSKLADAALRKGAGAKDLAALEVFYAERSDPPVWITSTTADALLAPVSSSVRLSSR